MVDTIRLASFVKISISRDAAPLGPHLEFLLGSVRKRHVHLPRQHHPPRLQTRHRTRRMAGDTQKKKVVSHRHESARRSGMITKKRQSEQARLEHVFFIQGGTRENCFQQRFSVSSIKCQRGCSTTAAAADRQGLTGSTTSKYARTIIHAE